MNADTVSRIMGGLAHAASTLGASIGGRTGDAFQVAGAITETAGALLTTRSPDEVIELLRELNDDPARRAGLGATRDRVARILARRRAEESE